MQLTPLLDEIMNKVIMPSVPNMKFDCTLNIVLSRLAKIVTDARVTLEGELVNYYCLCLAPSNSGKGHTTKLLKQFLLKGYSEYANRRLMQERNNYLNTIETDLKNKYPISESKKAKREKWKDAYTKAEEDLRFIKNEETLVGTSFQCIEKICVTLSKFAFGSLNIYVDEFGIFFKTLKTEDEIKKSYLYQLYEGDITTASYKSENNNHIIENVYCNAHLMGSPTLLIELRTKERLINDLNDGLGRRIFLTYDQEIKTKIIAQNNKKEKEYALDIISPELVRIAEILAKPERDFFVSKEAQKELDSRIGKWSNFLEETKRYCPESLRTEISGRWYKAKRLACIIACLEHPSDKAINAKDMKLALDIADRFGKYFEDYLYSKPDDEGSKLYKYLLARMGKWTTREELRNTQIYKQREFKALWNEEKESVQERAEKEGLIFLSEKYSKNGERYMLVNKEQLENLEYINIIEKMEKSKIYKPEEVDCLFSWSEDSNPATGYVSFTDEFAKLKYVITSKNKRYSAIQFKDEYRHGKNFDCEPNLIILDFDEGLKMSKAEKIFKPFLNCISPTKSHRKEKNGKINDCFRVILPCEPIPEKDYSQIMTNVINFYKSDPACKDKARYYDTCAESEVIYNPGFLFDWKVFKEVIAEAPKPQKNQVEKEMTFEDFAGSGKGLKEVIGTAEADRLYQKAGISFANGGRNNELSRIAMWLKDMVEKNDITSSQAIDEMWRLYHAMPDKTDFPTSEMKQLIKSKFGSC